MSLRDTNTVDMIFRIPGEPSRTALLMYDDGEFAEEGEREEAFRQKLNYYVSFVVSGQFADSYPALSETKLSVQVVCAKPPTATMVEIDSVSSPDQPKLILPVSVTGEMDFRARLGLTGKVSG